MDDSLFDTVIHTIMKKIGKEKEFKLDIANIDLSDINVIIDTLEDEGYTVDLSYGSNELVAYKS